MTVSNELIILVDGSGNPIGTAEKLPTHRSDTPLHLAFSCYVFKGDKLLVTQRANSKKVWPGVWSNSVCGHPMPEESLKDAIIRRLAYELGMTAHDFTLIVPSYTYKTPPFKGIIEHEFCPIFVARTDDEPHPNSDEVDDYRWMAWQDFVVACNNDDQGEYSWWCKDQVKILKDDQKFSSFIAA